MSKRTALLGLVLLAGCASRALPVEPAPESPLSQTAPAAPLPVVGTVLREDPPLPGEAAQGWTGLDEQTKPAAQEHEDGHAHH